MNGARCLVIDRPRSSIGSPMTFMHAAKRSGPTGTVIALAGVSDFWPRTMPSVVSIASVRTVLFAKMLRDLQDQTVALVFGFRAHSKSPAVAIELNVHDGAQNLGDFANDICGQSVFSVSRVLERLSARDDFDEFARDLRLTRPVVVQRQLVDHVAGVSVALSIADIWRPARTRRFQAAL